MIVLFPLGVTGPGGGLVEPPPLPPPPQAVSSSNEMMPQPSNPTHSLRLRSPPTTSRPANPNERLNARTIERRCTGMVFSIAAFPAVCTVSTVVTGTDPLGVTDDGAKPQ